MAQRLAQATHNRLVAGSNPAGPTLPFRVGMSTKEIHRTITRMSTKKAGLVLIVLGAVLFLVSLLVDYVGGGDRRLGANQVLGMEIGVIILLSGIFLAYLYPEHRVNIRAGIHTLLERLANLPVSAWVIVGFLIVYFLYFISPIFLNPERRIYYPTRYMSDSSPIGLDIRDVTRYIENWVVKGQSPYADKFIAYPPLALALFTPLLLLGYPAYYYFITFTTLLFYLVSTLLVPLWSIPSRKKSLVLLLFALGAFSYGFQFELERGQSNIIAFSLGLLAVYLYHSRQDSDYLAYLLFSVGLQMKIYPGILIVMFVKDWRDWKGNIKRIAGLLLFNLALLFILGPGLFKDFIDAVRGQQAFENPSLESHALKGYFSYLAEGDLPSLAPRTLAMVQQYQGQIELLLLAVLGLCLLSVLLSLYLQRKSGLNASLLVLCTICAMVIPSISNNYKLPILIAPMAILWGSITMPAGGWKKILSILLIIMTSVAYWSLQYPPTIKPEFLRHNFPALFVIAIVTTVLYFVAPRLPDISSDRHADDIAGA